MYEFWSATLITILMLKPLHVRFGSLADILGVICDVSPLPPIADIRRCCRHVAYYSGKGRSLRDDKPATTFNAIEP